MTFDVNNTWLHPGHGDVIVAIDTVNSLLLLVSAGMLALSPLTRRDDELGVVVVVVVGADQQCDGHKATLATERYKSKFYILHLLIRSKSHPNACRPIAPTPKRLRRSVSAVLCHSQ